MGAKTAYGHMAGQFDWVDEVITVEQGDSALDVHSSYHASAPEVRLYFMRLPDGAGAIPDPADYEILAQLEAGTRNTAETGDGEESYERIDLVNTLTGLVNMHTPVEVNLQVADGKHAVGEHTDHIHVTEFALEALYFVDHREFHVNHFVNYSSDDLPANLSP